MDGDARMADTNNYTGEGAAASGAAKVERKPYRSPRFQHLGSVRELTLGSGVVLPDIGSPSSTGADPG
jgi:hypothetical protein